MATDKKQNELILGETAAHFTEVENQLVLDMKSILTSVPKNMLKTRDDISKAITSSDLSDDNEQIIEMPDANSTLAPVKTRISLTYEGLEEVDITGKHKFTYFDKEVYDALVSLYKDGNTAVTVSMVYRVMTGKQNGEYVNPQKQKEVSRSIEKLRFMNLTIKIDPHTSGNFVVSEISGNMVNADRGKAKINGTPVEAYRLLDFPILYKYAASQNKVSEIPLEVLDTPLNKTKETITLQGYIINKIESAKSEGIKNIEILYDDIYALLDVKPSARKTRERLRNYIGDIIKYWKNEVSYIESYYETKQKNKKYSIKLKIKS